MVNFVSELQRCAFFLLLRIWLPPLILFSFYFPSKIASWGRCGRTSHMVAETLKRGGAPPFMVSTENFEKWTRSLSLSWTASNPLGGHSWPKTIQQGCPKQVDSVLQTNQKYNSNQILKYMLPISLCFNHVEQSENDHLFGWFGVPNFTQNAHH